MMMITKGWGKLWVEWEGHIAAQMVWKESKIEVDQLLVVGLWKLRFKKIGK